MTNPTSKAIVRPLADVGPHCPLSDEARALLSRHETPDDFVLALRRERRDAEALHFFAYWLPKRHAIWWGCLCAWHVCRPAPSEPARAVLRAVVQWVQEPTEPRRRAIEKLMDAAGGTSTVPGCLALAAVLSGGSLAPEGLPVVPPAGHLTAHTLDQLVQLAAVEKQPFNLMPLYAHFVDLGLDVRHGKHHWEKA